MLVAAWDDYTKSQCSAGREASIVPLAARRLAASAQRERRLTQARAWQRSERCAFVSNSRHDSRATAAPDRGGGCRHERAHCDQEGHRIIGATLCPAGPSGTRMALTALMARVISVARSDRMGDLGGTGPGAGCSNLARGGLGCLVDERTGRRVVDRSRHLVPHFGRPQIHRPAVLKVGRSGLGALIVGPGAMLGGKVHRRSPSVHARKMRAGCHPVIPGRLLQFKRPAHWGGYQPPSSWRRWCARTDSNGRPSDS